MPNGKAGWFSLGLQRPHPWPEPSPSQSSEPCFAPKPPTFATTPERSPKPPQSPRRRYFLQAFPSQRSHPKTPLSSTVTLLGSPFLLRLRPGLGFPFLQPSPVSLGHTPKPAALNSPEARAGWRRQSGEHSRGGGGSGEREKKIYGLSGWPRQTRQSSLTAVP